MGGSVGGSVEGSVGGSVEGSVSAVGYSVSESESVSIGSVSVFFVVSETDGFASVDGVFSSTEEPAWVPCWEEDVVSRVSPFSQAVRRRSTQ